MKCPHCTVRFHDEWTERALGEIGRIHWALQTTECPACGRAIIVLVSGAGRARMVYPKGFQRAPAPPQVPKDIADDYREACLVFADSQKASAALSRRCLQHLLEACSVSKRKNLSRQIDDALTSELPAHIADNLDAIRNIGNFVAHPQKSKHTAAILPVETGEAEWNLDVLELLFDFYYVQPAKSKAKKEALDKKLKDAGKLPMTQEKTKGKTSKTTSKVSKSQNIGN